MSFNKISFEESLAKHVVATEKCISCGTCVLTCPFGCLELTKETPTLIKECKTCGICAQACPRYLWLRADAEKFVFGRERKNEEEFGIYRKLLAVQAKDKRVLGVGQDGGGVTALLVSAFENGLIDGAIVAGHGREKPFLPFPMLAMSTEAIVECAGTKYTYSPNILALADAIKQKRTSIAFVGTPCQIHAIRKMQMAGLKKYVAPIKYLIGLLCSECFTYDGLMEKHIHEKLGINLSDIKKMNIKGKMLVTTNSGIVTIPLAEAKQYARKSCHFCDDFSAELADISTGGLGLDGWTFTIIRTEKGEELFSKAEQTGFLNVKPADTETNALNLLIKLSKKKREVSAVL
ncbi:MAG: Coenzyme F420 hydrogenase/dehydrogenase, beta subunit C-terminal domain [Candidatus Bathyarchaeia archaeon]